MEIIKAKWWAVVWTKKGAREYGVNNRVPITTLELFEQEIPVKTKSKNHKKTGYFYLNGWAIFPTKAEAEAERDKNEDFEVVPCEIKILR